MQGRQFDELLESIAAREPTPGGGAVAAMMASLASAVLEMVATYSIGPRRLTEHRDDLETAIQSLCQLRSEALQLADEDIAAYERLNALFKLDRDDPVRKAAWLSAVRGAIEAPQRTMRLASALIDLSAELQRKTSRMLRSDLAIAAIGAEAALRAAAWNVRINLPMLPDDSDKRRDIEASMEESLSSAVRIVAEIERIAAE